MRRHTVIASALLILLNAASGPAHADTEIAFGVTSATAFSLAHYVATEKKYYEEEKLKVETTVAGAAVGVLQQLAAGSLNLAQAATDQSLRAILRGAPIRIVAGAASNAPFRVVAAKTIKSWSELKGKTISVGGLTDVTLYFLRVMARKNGLADQDYDLLYGGGTPNRFGRRRPSAELPGGSLPLRSGERTQAFWPLPTERLHASKRDGPSRPKQRLRQIVRTA